MNQYYLATAAGKIEGPYSRDQVDDILRSGRLGPKPVYSTGGSDAWLPVNLLPPTEGDRLRRQVALGIQDAHSEIVTNWIYWIILVVGCGGVIAWFAWMCWG
jgi:hypothetical protein